MTMYGYNADPEADCRYCGQPLRAHMPDDIGEGLVRYACPAPPITDEPAG